MILTPSPAYTGPVQVVLGQYDYTFCSGDCSNMSTSATSVADSFYPNATMSEGYFVANNGHCINNHYAASDAFERVLEFLKKQGS